jgi:hypothetical protein
VPEDPIPENVRAFVAAHVESVLQLEILLLLHQQAAHARTADDIARELRIDSKWTTGQLAGLVTAGVLANASASPGAPPSFRYEPRTPELDAAVAGLARAYADRRVTVIGLIFSKPLDKLRSFADAFKLRKEKNDG